MIEECTTSVVSGSPCLVGRLKFSRPHVHVLGRGNEQVITHTDSDWRTTAH